MNKSIIIISFAFFLSACGSKQANEQEVVQTTVGNIVTLNDQQLKNAGIKTGKIETKAISSLLKLNGKIDVPPQNMASISIPLGGYLKATKLLPGMSVKKGEVLAVIEDPQYIQFQQDYLTAKAQYIYNESEFKRQRDLNESKASSDKVFEQARATYQTQYILIKSLEQKLRLIGFNPDKITANNISKSINIYSPIDGFVTAVNINIGKYVNPSDVLFELVNPTDIHLVLTVFDKDVDKLSMGQKLFAYTNTNPAKKYICEILLISKNISSDNSTQVHCHFKEFDNTLLPGMFMNAEIELLGQNSASLPEEAIVRFENKDYGFIDNGNGKFEMVELQIGNSENGFTEVLEANKYTDKTFVINGAYNLLMALKNVSEE